MAIIGTVVFVLVGNLEGQESQQTIPCYLLIEEPRL
jgi:hypothetical protein